MPRDVSAVCKIALAVGCLSVAANGGIISTVFAVATTAALFHVLEVFFHEE